MYTGNQWLHVKLVLKAYGAALSVLQPWDAGMDCSHPGGVVCNLLGSHIPCPQQT